MSDFTGKWFTTFGSMELQQAGDRIRGTYEPVQGVSCGIEGEVRGGVLDFHYQEPDARGTGSFRPDRQGKFSGRWRAAGTGHTGFWHGHRGFDGVWDTTCGPLRLIHEAGRILGFYEIDGDEATLEGSVTTSTGATRVIPSSRGGVDRRFVFRFQERKCAGEGWFELDEGERSFRGKWRPAGSRSWQSWVGHRVVPIPDLQWLVVFEAHWQQLLQEKDYSLGGMLREFFARASHVEVRHRFFASETDLATWCREILYLPEPVVLVVATHGTPDGIQGHRGVIGPDAVVQGLRHADNVEVLHFSACYIEDGATGGPPASLRRGLPFPISGYAAYVDWTASALVDFTYLDMILEHYLSPEESASRVKQLLTFAGDRASRESPFPATRFRFWPAGNGKGP